MGKFAHRLVFKYLIYSWLRITLNEDVFQNEKDCKEFLQDLCTQKEMENMAERVYAAQLLLEGMTYNQIMELADISSATLSRVSRCVQYGTGYANLLKK